ncbi:hypothetical protein R5H30_19500 [Sulfitobacter sp. D35]|uniref:hypothetical protein n=1 Tax=Sulfitobacter sp. D35 TaxID=3083252 RepID=UPI00296F9B19|nr:hypothetical protein [Sulfitobacter sp. D35]MDW4500182.1 hypothetical protein [Sulfitobacter sp. D35]
MKYPRLIDEGSVWIVVAPMVIWAAHFLVCYWIAAVICARDIQSDLDILRLSVLGLTALCIALLAVIGGMARQQYGGRLIVDEEITGNEVDARSHFLGHVALLLCALGIVAVIFTAVPTLVFEACR